MLWGKREHEDHEGPGKRGLDTESGSLPNTTPATHAGTCYAQRQPSVPSPISLCSASVTQIAMGTAFVRVASHQAIPGRGRSHRPSPGWRGLQDDRSQTLIGWWLPLRQYGAAIGRSNPAVVALVMMRLCCYLPDQHLMRTPPRGFLERNGKMPSAPPHASVGRSWGQLCAGFTVRR